MPTRGSQAARAALEAIHRRIVRCRRCPRLRAYCREVARVQQARRPGLTYWARPVPGFGDPHARVLVVGLAPAAHGANRTGRLFTGDVPGGSGDFLMRVMHRTGFANQPSSRDAHDGLRLTGAYLAAAVRCAPPANRPTPAELRNCLPHLAAELAALPEVRVVVALGRLAFDACWKLAAHKGVDVRPRPPFVHGRVYQPPAMPLLVASYHPSRQNTQTGRLTAAMLERVFRTARRLAFNRPSRGGGVARPRRPPQILEPGS
jgi:uracil-DNA glycosylase family 4